ncbi:MAG: hypothetical protein COB20_15310 [SAR86 cluster bacterium]|uniref:DUF4760 domain-containing protein n=1 Tax=SAR86 cluster bacterium TaxID=2030880 RepID=A0A2A4WVQ8_9GAMM|nr:MAG: hypothetical protein COB20_15310 [SAR86 cluster bacterium]
MSIQDWGAIGESVSAIAIIVTLVYLSIQVKYARIAASNASRGDRVAGIHNIELQFMSDPEFRTLWAKLAGPGLSKIHEDVASEWDLSIDETLKIISYGASWVWLHWAQFRPIKTPEDEAELKNIISVWYGEGPMRTIS